MGRTGPKEGTDMTKAVKTWQPFLALIIGCITLPAMAQAQHQESVASVTDNRWEFWVALSSWPSLSDLDPVAGGSFNQVGYGLGASVHWPVKAMAGADLMLGVEGAIMASDSNIPVLLDDLLARDGYLAVSAKLMLGENRNLSFDTGLAYHLVDIAQLETDYNSSVEFESWEETAVGPFVGATWDFGAGETGDDGGVTLGLRAHFLDFGTVRDEDVLASVVLGRDAGDLEGPLFVVQIGYRW